VFEPLKNPRLDALLRLDNGFEQPVCHDKSCVANAFSMSEWVRFAGKPEGWNLVTRPEKYVNV
jgi:hypothetical protein